MTRNRMIFPVSFSKKKLYVIEREAVNMDIDWNALNRHKKNKI